MNEQSRSQPKVSTTSIGSASGSAMDNSDKPVSYLIKELANDVTSLFTKEVALAKSEIGHSIEEAKEGAISLLSGGAVFYAGFLFLLLAAVAGLAEVVELWLAALIVGGVVAVLGFIMVQAGKKKLQPSSLKPQHTMNSLNKDRDTLRGATK